MTAPDYSRTAVTVAIGGKWRNVCPVDCSWHGSDWEGRDAAVSERDDEAKRHKCLKATEEGGKS